MKTRILLVEDDTRLADLTAEYLRKNDFEVTVESRGDTAEARILHDNPGLVILDVMLPGLGGFTVLESLRRQSDVYVLMLTARADEVDKLIGLSVGADDYLTKPFSPRELIARVNTVLRRPRRQTHGTQLTAPREFGRLRVDAEGRDVWVDDQQVGLTRTEFDILDALSARPNVALSRRQIIDSVWGPGWVGDDHVVDVHVANLRKKLDDPPAEPCYILTVRGVGYRMGPGA